MKRYIKDNTIRFASEIVIIKNGMQIINPTEEQILADGWVEYIQPEPTIDELKRQKIDELNTYYNAEGTNGVNQFFVNNIPLWLDPTLRGNIQRQIEANILLNNPTTNLPINGIVVSIPNDTAKIMLAKLELYAGECYNVREAKEKEISAFQTKEEIEKYDVTIDYPEKLKFEL